MLSGVVTPGLGSEETTLLGGGRAGFVVVAAGAGVPGRAGGGAAAEDEVVEDGGGGVAAGGGGAEESEVLGSCRFAWRCLGLIFSATLAESWRAKIRSDACNFMTTGGNEGGARQRVEDKRTRDGEREKR